jgi:predicted dehydrogenase
MSRNIALIGCGAIARAFYLPALAKHRAEFGRLWLVDPSEHALSIAASIVPGRQAHHLMDVGDEIHLVIVATPNQLHFPLALEALSRGAHVLIEKPFVIWMEEGRKLVEAAAANNRVVAINQTRRFFPLARELRQQINEGEFGSLKSVVHREGTKLTWPFESGAAFAQGAQRTGVIMDFGVHVIDFYHYLLQPRWTFVSAIHDGFRGPEGLAEIELQANDAPVSIRLSRYYPQENVAHLVFERAKISFNVYDAETYSIRSNLGKATSYAIARAGAEYGSHAEPLLLNFLAASEKRESAVCDAASSLPVIEILDKIYRLARQYPAKLGSV